MTFFVTTLYNTNSHLNPKFTNVFVTYITVTPNLNEWKSEQAHMYTPTLTHYLIMIHIKNASFTIIYNTMRRFLRRAALTKKTKN